MKVSKAMLREFCAAASATGLLNLDEALISAAKRGRTDVVQTLLDGGADVHASIHTSYSRDEALCVAAGCGHTRTVKALLAAGADVHAYAKDSNGIRDLPLRSAASSGHAETIAVLLQAGADVHVDRYGIPDVALLNAAEGGHTEAVKVLLAAGAANYWGALQKAWKYPRQRNEETIQLLRADAMRKGYPLPPANVIP